MLLTCEDFVDAGVWPDECCGTCHGKADLRLVSMVKGLSDNNVYPLYVCCQHTARGKHTVTREDVELVLEEKGVV